MKTCHYRTPLYTHMHSITPIATITSDYATSHHSTLSDAHCIHYVHEQRTRIRHCIHASHACATHIAYIPVRRKQCVTYTHCVHHMLGRTHACIHWTHRTAPTQTHILGHASPSCTHMYTLGSVHTMLPPMHARHPNTPRAHYIRIFIAHEHTSSEHTNTHP